MNKRSWRRGAALVCALTFFLMSRPAEALTQLQYNTLTGGVYYVNTEDDMTCAANVSTTLNGNDNAEKVWNYLISRVDSSGQPALTAIQVAGIMGNLTQEHHFNTADAPIVNGGYGGLGIVQWIGSRREAAIALAAQQGKPVTDLGVQLDYLWSELQGSEKASYDALRQTTTIEDATTQFELKFERAGDPQMAKRIQFAHEAFNTYAGQTSPASAADGTALVTSPGNVSTGDCSATTAGSATLLADGFTVYQQCGESWSGLSYGPGDVCANGCGPSAMAMAITALTGQAVTPAQTVPKANELGQVTADGSSKWTIASALAPEYGLKSTKVDADVAAITQVLQNGGVVVASGRGALPFTTGGHYIVIRAVSATGKWLIGDSGHKDTNTQEWDPNQIIGDMNAGSAYAITK
ncbi:MAG: hypothetical protein JWM37_224 [Candidatus Saccharibacteria bacterium]|nr:hypothetical protein [Candidatus Saccharibacteria bacterium]